ncbi:hypothetical protein [Streptomyces sp. NBC_00620]|uniref:hypothetical protein n=1 Tax=Streptomyces sp. NBC_00620 TaxID=2903666 RepID=UPI00225B5667|nr:hypothetical protein [Streptomyces sp. NBC_00620]MCX4972768.1 hypothetical protein [Streptomyces sp. NBC_00620]
MNDFTPPEDGEPTRFAKAKNWCKKHEPRFRAAGGATLAIGGVILAATIASRIEGRDAERYEVEDWDPLSAPEEADQSRQSFLGPDRDPFLRRLPAGQHASEEAKARYRELVGDELPDGYTVVRRWLYETVA